MKKLLVLLISLMVVGCSAEPEIVYTRNHKDLISAEIELAVAMHKVKAPEGTYFSELTGLPVSLDIKDQRPIAVMVDNEILAYPHYGLAEADVVYELVNSNHNNRISRLMVMKKDWGSIVQMGSIRSTRDTNIDLQAEWNSILCHDGSSAISLPKFNKGYASEHISGTFSRVNNGKSREFTEFILPGDIEANLASLNISKDYNEYKPNVDSHFRFPEFEEDGEMLDSDEYASATTIILHAAFPHNSTELHYNPDTKSYDYYNYGALSADGEDNEVQSYKNVILQDIILVSTDNEGHVAYNLVDSGRSGYYISNGHVQKITWEKKEEMDITRYYDENGEELIINRGNTYIGLIPSEAWESIVVE